MIDAVRAVDFGIVEEQLDGNASFQSPLTRRLWDWWRSANRGEVPRWSGFDIADHPALAAHAFVVRRIGGDFEFRLYGEAAIAIIGRNDTGQVVRRDEAGAHGGYLHGYYERVLASARCWRCSGTLLFAGREHRRFESVDAPLIRTGPGPDVILGVIDLVP